MEGSCCRAPGRVEKSPLGVLVGWAEEREAEGTLLAKTKGSCTERDGSQGIGSFIRIVGLCQPFCAAGGLLCTAFTSSHTLINVGFALEHLWSGLTSFSDLSYSRAGP